MPLIEQQEVLDALNTQAEEMSHWHERYAEQRKGILTAIRIVSDIKPKQEIIRCKDCKHWNLQVGNVKGDGLGSCDFHNVNFVTGEGFCYWAEKRGSEDGTD